MIEQRLFYHRHFLMYKQKFENVWSVIDEQKRLSGNYIQPFILDLARNWMVYLNLINH